MKYLYVLLGLLLPLSLAIAQSVIVGTISRLTLCTGDTVWVPYSASGSFKSDNFFAVQLSDANGSFATFTNIGHDVAAHDSIPVIIGYAGDHFKVRVIATDPYTISDNTSTDVRYVNYPSPNPSPKIKSSFYGPTAFIGDEILFQDASSEPVGSKYLWSFDQDANISLSTDPSPKVIYSSEGEKSGRLTVSNGVGCTTTKEFSVRIFSCMPVIPDSAHIVTGNEAGSFPIVWVKTGGNYSTNREDYTIIFVEAGASLRAEFRSIGLYYIKNGASYTSNSDQGEALVILNDGGVISFDPIRSGTDTMYCHSLQFDYSQVGGTNDVKTPENPLQIFNSLNNLRVNYNGAEISALIVNTLGNEVLSKAERDALSLNLTTLANGIYFAVITAGDQHTVQKIVVIH